MNELAGSPEQKSRDRVSRPLFIADCMVGKLARWLRLLGFDVSYYSKIEDAKLIELAAKENRIILTRDHELIKKVKKIESLQGRFLLIESERWEEQVEQVLDHFKLRDKIKPNSRCLDCNAELKSLPKDRARNLVPPFIYEQASAFALCPVCGRIFWKGTHFRDMENKLRRFTRP
ncbi:MAG TPA: Mut7-C RNAse domain-containing protein [Candidatus Saccharicenans sp.]|nr:Mut7-C RNAse domain-containing protein [Candidatus Saccharicenans sp.]HOL46439.1 Mut7-C RNAse domain-containing protein [Candidatus Saccharicenans sp.]HOP60125.1 Mut7-C RNAse domain-containing protein [Candidatus Saccharicenans sp.]HOT69191.1 Mut7-C RNAse domain-containing protein [Candidatus Saccharicenans sp.]HPC88636.1 Mut7-C RNAse domain-containing protein [Candidatus Saccharicenans sp.]